MRVRGREGGETAGSTPPAPGGSRLMHSARGGGLQPHGVNRILLHFSIENHKGGPGSRTLLIC